MNYKLFCDLPFPQKQIIWDNLVAMEKIKHSKERTIDKAVMACNNTTTLINKLLNL